MSYQHIAYKNMSHMVSKTQQVVMLYDGAIRFCMQAADAISRGDIETRYNSLVKACDIITGLQLCLDFENGGQISKLLYDYYAGLDMRLLMVHQNNDVKLVESCVENLKTMREAWVEIDGKMSEGEISEIDIAQNINESDVVPLSGSSDMPPITYSSIMGNQSAFRTSELAELISNQGLSAIA